MCFYLALRGKDIRCTLAVSITTGLIPTATISFKVREPNQILIISGSMFVQGTDGMAAAEVLVDAKLIGSIQIFQNGPPRHLAFPTQFLAMHLSPGKQHELNFKKVGATSDPNDTFNVYLFEYS
jgi:hypothetical protein